MKINWCKSNCGYEVGYDNEFYPLKADTLEEAKQEVNRVLETEHPGRYDSVIINRVYVLYFPEFLASTFNSLTREWEDAERHIECVRCHKVTDEMTETLYSWFICSECLPHYNPCPACDEMFLRGSEEVCLACR